MILRKKCLENESIKKPVKLFDVRIINKNKESIQNE